jgi:hypothetical protein
MAGPMNAKNTPLSPAAQDLGLGAALQTQQEDASEEAKKKAQQEAAMNKMGLSGPANTPFGGGAVNSLFGG